jgi:hypothetical protein
MANDTIEIDENLIVAIIALSKFVNNVHRIKSIGIVKMRYLPKEVIIFLKSLLKILANTREIKHMDINKGISRISKVKVINDINKINFT